jgi:hypothetical protein
VKSRMPKTGSWVARMGCAFIALGACAATHGQSIVTSNYSNQTGSANNNVIYKVTATPQTALPPSLSLAPLLNINPLAPNPATYAGFNSLVWVPSTQSGATVDLIASQTESASEIWRFFGPNFSGVSTVPGPPNATQIWACGDSCPGPQGPISLAVDTHGTLYVLSLDTVCESSVVELWAFAPVAISANNPAGFATTPTLIDSNVAGNGGANCAKRDYSLINIDAGNASLTSEYPYELSVMDLMIAPPGVALPVTANDVLVLFGDSANCATGVNPVCSGNSVALLADYSSSTLATLVSGASASYYGSGPNAPVPLTVANSGDVPGWGTVLDSATEMQYFYPENGVSLAAWPANSTILLMTSLGNVYNFSWTPGTPGALPAYLLFANAPFWIGLPAICSDDSPSCTALNNAPNGMGGFYNAATLRTAGNPYAFVTAYTQGNTDPGPFEGSNPSELLSLDGIHPPQTATENDGPLAGLAISGNIPPPPPPAEGGTGTSQGCAMPGGCNITGGVQQQIMGTAAAIAAVEALTPPNNLITENVCIVHADPRHICNNNAPPPPGNKLYNSKTLPVASVCPTTPPNPSFGNTVIPDYMCGNYGSGGEGSGTGLVVIQGIAKGVDSIPGLLDYSDANPDFFFNSTRVPCPTQPLSDILVGWAPWTGDTNIEGTIPEGLNMTEVSYGCGSSKATSSGMSLLLVGTKLNLNGVTEFKPNNLVSFAEFKYGNFLLDVAAAPIDLIQKVRLLAIVVESELFLINGNTQCAAKKIWRADKFVSDHAAHFHGTLGHDPNPYGRSRSRLANLFFTIYSRIEGNPPPSVWPVSKPPGSCLRNVDIDKDGY